MSLAGVDWIGAWFRAGLNLGFEWEARPLGALVLAPCETGLTKRRCTSSEATRLLRDLLDLDDASGVSSHTLKATTLTWCGKRGLSEAECLLLGHHVTGSKSRAVYSRELLSAPLRAYTALIREICDGDFRPDASRSGWLSERTLLRLRPSEQASSLMQEPLGGAAQLETGMTVDEFQEILGGVTPDATSQDKSDSFIHVEAPERDASPQPPESGGERSDEEQASSSSSSSSSSSESPSEGGNALREEKLLQDAGAAQDFDIPGPLWQHYKSKMLRKASGENKTVCGRHVKSPIYDHLPGGSVSRWTRCAVCFKNGILRSRKQLSNALEALTSKDTS